MSSSSKPCEYDTGGTGGATEQEELVVEINDNDVLLGRGAPLHEGNLRFKKIIRSRRDEYLSSSRRREKEWISKQVVSAVKKQGGRFLRRVCSLAEARRLGTSQSADTWVHVEADAVLLKVKQSMRDRSLDNDVESEESKPPERKRVRAGKMADEEKDQKAEEHKEEQNSSQQQPQREEQPRPQPQVPISDHKHQRDEDVSYLEEEKTTAQRHRVEAAPPLLPILQQLQQQSQQHQSLDLVSFLMQQQQMQGYQQQNLVLAELQRQEQERTIAQLIEEQRLRNALQTSLGYGGSGGGGGGGGGLPSGASVSDLSASFTDGLSGLASLASQRFHQQVADNWMLPPVVTQYGSTAASLDGPVRLADTGIQAREILAAALSDEQQLSTSIGSASTRQTGERPKSPEASQETETSESMLSSGEWAIQMAFARRDKNPTEKLDGQYLELSLIEGCLLSVLSSVGLPQWTADDMACMFISSPGRMESQGATTSFTWSDLSNLLKKKLDELKNDDNSKDAAVAKTARDEQSLTSRAAALALSFTKDPQELARLTVMLLQKMKEHSRMEQLQDVESSSLSTGDRHGQAHWEYLAVELGRWAYTLDVLQDGTGHPVAQSLNDMTPNGAAEEEALTPMSALDRENSRKILIQIAWLSRLGGIFRQQTGQEIVSALKGNATIQSAPWVSRPFWWVQQEKESITRDLWLLETLIGHGLANILDVPTASRTFPVACLRDAGLTEADIEERVFLLITALHWHFQSAKMDDIIRERTAKLSSLIRGTDDS